MPSSDSTVVIVGGGVAGLTAAHRLHDAGIAFRLLEARSRLGGRVLSMDETGRPSDDGFDLGPSWFWPDMQPSFAALADAFGLASFAQHADGDVLIQQAPSALQRFAGFGQPATSMRLVGGTSSIVTRLTATLPPTSVELGARVTEVRHEGKDVELSFIDGSRTVQRCRASIVVLALPPRLLEATISFIPPVDRASAARWRGTPTWMAPHAKFFAIYDVPFWRAQGLSGTAQSAVGPLTEIHDATTSSGKAALFGFLGLPAQERISIGQEAISASCVRQLTALFGAGAAKPRATLFKDWAADPLTATELDRSATGHPTVDQRPWVGVDWRNRILLAGSETSDREPGYLAGAVEAAERASAAVIAHLKIRANHHQSRTAIRAR